MKALDFERTKKAHDTPLPVIFPLGEIDQYYAFSGSYRCLSVLDYYVSSIPSFLWAECNIFPIVPWNRLIQGLEAIPDTMN